jgi:hypothetical protein
MKKVIFFHINSVLFLSDCSLVVCGSYFCGSYFLFFIKCLKCLLDDTFIFFDKLYLLQEKSNRLQTTILRGEIVLS